MKHQNYNEQVAFMAASLIELSDMSETELSELVQIVGAKAISELLAMDSLREDLVYEEMAEEICNYIGWEPMLTLPPREDAELDRLGQKVAELVGPVQYDFGFAAARLVYLFCSDEVFQDRE